MTEIPICKFGDKIPLQWEYGPVSFGFSMAGAVVSWSSAGAKDLLLSRSWEGVFLYPSKELSDVELCREPIRVCGDLVYVTLAFPVDWNRDGRGGLILTDRVGFIYHTKRTGTFPNLAFDSPEPFVDDRTRLPFNIPWDNPNHPQVNDLGGYVEPHFFNYTYPVHYPLKEKPGFHWIVGDWAGNLWWIDDVSGGEGEPRYRGVPYTKPSRSTRYAQRYLDRYGTEYVRPEEKITDETGHPFLLGEGVDGDKHFTGGTARPVLYRNPVTNTTDLLVMAGQANQQLLYLQYAGMNRNFKPMFKNLGEVPVHGMDISTAGFHSYPIVYENEGWQELLVPRGSRIAVLKNLRLRQPVPEYRFSHWLSGAQTQACGGHFSELLKTPQGKTFILDDAGTHWEWYEIKQKENNIRLSFPSVPLKDQNGIFTVEGETDPQLSPAWGYHRVSRWNFDRTSGQNLVVGTDTGRLYLLIEETETDDNEPFRFRSVGPLKDYQGNVIKIHNRVCAAGVDLNGNGREDLIVAGATYQLGVHTDPRPGGGIYYIGHRGLDDEGLPILDVPIPLELRGFSYNFQINSMVQIQALDLDEDGQKEIVIAEKFDGWKGRIFKVGPRPPILEYTGKIIPQLRTDEWLTDIDGDGRLELVFAGNENGVGYYRKIAPVGDGTE